MNTTNNESNPITPIAITNWRDIRRKFGIKEKNRRGHMYIVGKTGTGKSSLIANMAISDIRQGNGITLIDPHGDLADTILSYIPKERIDDVVYFNPGDFEHPIALNPLANIPKDSHHFVVSGLLSVFKKIWSEFWGPRLEHILRYCLYTLLEYQHGTLLDITPLLTQAEFRKRILPSVTEKPVLSFWDNEFDKYSAWLRSEATAPILNKMSHFLTSLPLRNIVGQTHNNFKFRELMDHGKILIVNLSKGSLGEDNSSLLGSMIATLIYLAAVSRARIPEEQRRSFYCYVDEFHNFVTLSFADVLSEARKYGLHLVLAHQYVRQLHESIRDAIFGNVGTLIAFRVGTDDAQYLEKEFSPTFNLRDLINLPNYNIYLKLMVDGVTSQPFSGTTLSLPDITQTYKSIIIEQSRRKYSRPRSQVEKEIALRNNVLPIRESFQERLL